MIEKTHRHARLRIEYCNHAEASIGTDSRDATINI